MYDFSSNQENFYHFNLAKIVVILVNSLNTQSLSKQLPTFVFLNGFLSPKYSTVLLAGNDFLHVLLAGNDSLRVLLATNDREIQISFDP